MVNSRNRDSKFANYHNKTEELNEWIRKVRTKKVFKKRVSHGTDLRTMAILTQALHKAEYILRQKQEERAQKWARIKSHLTENNAQQTYYENVRLSQEEVDAHKKQIDDMWSNELNGLNNFMKNLHQIKVN